MLFYRNLSNMSIDNFNFFYFVAIKEKI